MADLKRFIEEHTTVKQQRGPAPAPRPRRRAVSAAADLQNSSAAEILAMGKRGE
ncbi:hypothetical protein [Bifidobacterium ramosum]|uniref:hypothetical protein n=1 Tax=Bifidobacterium ramosum TaxID=1798158 RepID=UPI0013D82E6B|nr:hypothetical protein [Bifidobacterium ramosum]